MNENVIADTSADLSSESEQTFTRFSIAQRIEHAVLLVSFATLAVTGLAQKYSSSPYSMFLFSIMGGVEISRLVHRSASIVLMFESIYHTISVLYKVYVLRVPLSMLPYVDDLKHLLQDVLYYLGIRQKKANYGRYSYPEKAEYLAVVWGTLIMAVTGFMMWNPIASARWFPGELIPAAKAAHGGEAVLAILAIIIWHFYHVHLRHFNLSMFTGKLSRKEMESEHPAELQFIETGQTDKKPPPEIIRKRQRVFLPAAFVLTGILGFGLYKFVSLEQTAVITQLPRETAQVYAPITPTPNPTPTSLPTPAGGEVVSSDSWEGKYSRLFRNRCATCHGKTSVGGLSLETYQDALNGGDNGPAIVPGNPDASLLVQVQSPGSHPGQLTVDELDSVINWILEGAQ